MVVAVIMFTSGMYTWRMMLFAVSQIQDNGNLQLWEEDEDDAYKNQGAQGSETWWSYQSFEIVKKAHLLNTTAPWMQEDYREINELLIVCHGGLKGWNGVETE